MPTMTIRVTNAAFNSDSDGEFASVDDAYQAAVRSGVEIATDEVFAGASSAIVQVTVKLPGDEVAARGAVAISTARLTTD